MRKVLSFVVAVIVGGLIGTAGAPAALAESFELVEGKTFDTGLVKDFYLEGNSIPTQKRNSAMIKCPCGKRLVFGLLDTTGYSSEIQTKYVGMVLVEKKTMLGAAEIPVGAYGFGLVKPAQGDGPAKLVVYDIAGGRWPKRWRPMTPLSPNPRPSRWSSVRPRDSSWASTPSRSSSPTAPPLLPSLYDRRERGPSSPERGRSPNGWQRSSAYRLLCERLPLARQVVAIDSHVTVFVHLSARPLDAEEVHPRRTLETEVGPRIARRVDPHRTPDLSHLLEDTRPHRHPGTEAVPIALPTHGTHHQEVVA